MILMFDTAAILVVVIFSLRNEKRPENTAEFGPFRIKPYRPPEASVKAAVPARRRMRSL